MDIILIQKGVVYICGDGNKMARDVQHVISELLGARLAGTGVSGEAYLQDMKSKGRLLMDIWTS
jgi:sulfite reductase alpha subunit-like flavoprotein